jgi:hypothetical protein
VSRLPQIDNTVGARAIWTPGRWFWELDYSHDNYFSDDAAFNYLNRSSEYLVFRCARRLATNSQLGVEASASLTDYALPTQSNNRSLSLGPYLTWQITSYLQADVRGGYTFYDFDAAGANSPAQTLDSYYASLNLTHHLTQRITQTVSVERDISLGLNRGNNYNQELTAAYDLNWTATSHLGLGLNVTYENGSQPLELPNIFGFPAPATEDYSRVGFGPIITYQVTRKLQATLTCTHWDRTSSISAELYTVLPRDSYKDNDLLVRLNYSF